MADIGNAIDAILGAKYGEEVRENIATALEAMNSIAEDAEKWTTGAGTSGEGGGTVPGTKNNSKYFFPT